MKTGQFIHAKLGLIRWSATWDPEAPPPFGGDPEQRGSGTIQFRDPFDGWLGTVVFDSRTHVRTAAVADVGAISEALRWFEEKNAHVQAESTPMKTLQRAIENWFGDAAREIAGVIIEEQSNAS